jgi:hypothetical protein
MAGTQIAFRFPRTGKQFDMEPERRFTVSMHRGDTRHAMRILSGILLLTALLAAPRARAADARAYAADLTFTPSGAPVASNPPASPAPGESLYLDWVSPLQTPRGLKAPATDRTTVPADGGVAAVFVETPPPSAIPEPGSLALLAVSLLPLAPLFLRRQQPSDR